MIYSYDRINTNHPIVIDSPTGLSNMIHNENQVTIKRTLLFDPNLANLMKEISIFPPNEDTFSLIISYLLNIALRSHAKQSFASIFDIVRGLILTNIELAYIFLTMVNESNGKINSC